MRTKRDLEKLVTGLDRAQSDRVKEEFESICKPCPPLTKVDGYIPRKHQTLIKQLKQKPQPREQKRLH